MSDLDSDELTLLSRARAGLSPVADAQARVRRLLAGPLAGGSLPANAGARTGGSNPLPARTAGWGSRLVAAAAIAGVSGAGGYWLGHRAARREAAALGQPAPPPIAHDAPVAGPPPAETPVVAGALPAPDAPATRARRSRPVAHDPLPAPSAELLAREVTALRGIERALRDDQPALALALLGELDRAVPEGKLMEEREATSAIARCALGRIPLGLDLGEDFAESHPDSVYLARVQQACARKAAR
jgi:hypothetical protein